MNLELAQFIASHSRNYPRGMVFQQAPAPAVTLVVAFVSAAPLTEAESALIEGAAERGLKLSKDQYAITRPNEVPTAAAVVMLGPTSLPPGFSHPQIIRTIAPSLVVSNPEKKREFWDSIKRLAR